MDPIPPEASTLAEQAPAEPCFQVGDTLVAWRHNGRRSDTRFVRVMSVTSAGNLRVQELVRNTTVIRSNAFDAKWEQRPGEGETEAQYIVRKSQAGQSLYINHMRYFCRERYDPQRTYTDSYTCD